MTPYRSTWKRTSDYDQIQSRPSSPVQPQIEPLSPPPSRAGRPSFSHPALPQAQFSTSSRSNGSNADSRGTQRDKRSQRKASNTIDDLAEAALANNVTPSAHPRKSSAPTRHPNFGHWSGTHSQHTDGERPAKRARSEAGPSLNAHLDNSRPVTDYYGATFKPEQQSDQKPAKEARTTNLEDAALLLNFASTFAPRPANTQRNQHSPAPPNPSAIPAYIPPVQPTALRATIDLSASLPSPREMIEESKHLALKEQGIVNGIKERSALEQPSTEHQPINDIHQTETPPEDEQQSEQTAGLEENGQDQQQDDITMADEASTPGAGGTEKKQKRGWPKGKPRGPRKSGVTTTKPRSSTGKRTRKSVARAKTTDDGEPSPLPRRKSESDITSALSELTPDPTSRSTSMPPNSKFVPPRLKAGRKAVPKVTQDTICAGCEQSRNSSTGEHDQWISCNGCKRWLHSDCAGFRNERDVRDVDKFFCKSCEPKHGATTFVRKSTRAHTAVDYAGLNQGVLRTSDDCHEHHYIQPIKDNTLYDFDPEYFPRIRPEYVVRDYFERAAMFSEPILIPAEFNPPRRDFTSASHESVANEVNYDLKEDESILEDMEYDVVPDDGQDRLGMIIPRDLTVRMVCDLVGPDYPLEVIDVKEQGTSGIWNLAKWADYYEQDGEKEIHNVISLEVSETKLGRMLRRPDVVRQIDLQDNVWPKDEPAKSVAFYCLMSAADSYTDFHIDFGGSSVYYHILRGSKTFFFIPPKPKHLKAYEEWNNDPEQNHTFLGDKTKECYRVDLKEGDTMLIPSGWIHAVWTPANSLVIGGNFLTHMHYSMQFRVSDIEKANKTPLKFRYPKFQKVMWYSVIKYLERDPLPQSVRDMFYSGQKFQRDSPNWQNFDEHAANSETGPENYNARYYPQMELDGLPELVSFIFRTVMIQLDRIEGVTEETRKNVIRSIPKGFGEPLDVARTFALWVAWKRGNEDPPAWAHPDAVLPEKEGSQKKLSARMLKAMQRQEAIEAYRVAPDRQSARQIEAQAKAEAMKAEADAEAAAQMATMSEAPGSTASPAPTVHERSTSAHFTSTPKTSVLGPKRVACDACRRRRIKCKHKDIVATTGGSTQSSPVKGETYAMENRDDDAFGTIAVGGSSMAAQFTPQHHAVAPPAQMAPMQAPVQPVSNSFMPPGIASMMTPVDGSNKRGRSKACADCRRSKRRCIHDDNGRIDPVKEKQAPVPRGNMPKKRKSTGETDGSPVQKRVKQQQPQSNMMMIQQYDPQLMQEGPSSALQPGMSTGYEQAPADWQNGHVYPDPEGGFDSQANGVPYHNLNNTNSYNFASLQQFANDVLDLNGGPNESAIHPDLRGSVQAPTAPQMMGTDEANMPQSSGLVTAENGDKSMDATHHVSVDSGVSMPDDLAVKPAATGQHMNDGVENVVTEPANVDETNGMIQRTEEPAIAIVEQAVDNGRLGTAQTPTKKVASVTIADAALSSTWKSPQLTKHMEPEPTPPSSPLTAMESSPPPRDTIRVAMEATPRHSSRQAKAIDRFSNTTYDTTNSRAVPEPKVSSAKTSNKRKSATPAPDKTKKHKPIAAAEKSPSKKRRNSITPANDAKREMSQSELQDEESLRLARELQSEGFGLRRRKSTAGL
ncbi:hypothetical protein MBLNU457_2370t2 [Dothideomycetes sp. NU457]